MVNLLRPEVHRELTALLVYRGEDRAEAFAFRRAA